MTVRDYDNNDSHNENNNMSITMFYSVALFQIHLVFNKHNHSNIYSSPITSNLSNK